jgi:hypothetical protein
VDEFANQLIPLLKGIGYVLIAGGVVTYFQKRRRLHKEQPRTLRPWVKRLLNLD